MLSVLQIDYSKSGSESQIGHFKKEVRPTDTIQLYALLGLGDDIHET